MRKTFKQILTEYGAVAVVVYFTIFFGVLFGAWAALESGVDLPALAERLGLPMSRTAASVGSFTLAYLFTKVLQPVRIAATLALTPVMARLYERVTGRGAARLARDADGTDGAAADPARTDDAVPAEAVPVDAVRADPVHGSDAR